MILNLGPILAGVGDVFALSLLLWYQKMPDWLLMTCIWIAVITIPIGLILCIARSGI